MIKSILLVFLFLIAIYFIGWAICRICKINVRRNSFVECAAYMVIGLVSAVSLYSLFVTKGNTISLGIIGILILCLLRAKKQTYVCHDNYSFSEYKNVIISAFVITICFFAFHAYFFFNTPYNNEAHFDYFCYSALGDCMVNRGIESLNCVNDLLAELNLSPTPYHYFEIWLSMLIATIGGITAAESIFVETYVILSVIYALCLLAIVRCYSKNIVVQIISFSAVLLGGVVCANTSIELSMFNFIQRTSIVAPLCNTKTIAMALFMAVSVLAFIHDKILFYYVAMAVPLVCISITPAVYSALGCMMLYDFFVNNNGNRKNIAWSFAALFVSALFIIAFYFLQGDSSYTMDDFSFRIILENIRTNLSEMIKSAVKFPFFFLLYHFAFIAIFVYLYFKEKKCRPDLRKLTSMFVFVIVLEIVAFVVSLCYKGNYDWFQFMEMPTLFLAPIYVLFFAFSIQYSGHAVLKTGVGITYVLLLVYSVWGGYYQTGLRGIFYDMKSSDDVAYIQAIEKEFLEKHENKVGEGIRDVYDDAFPYRTRVGLPYQFCPQIPTLNLKTINICTLTPIRPEWQNEETVNRRNNNTFTRFANQYQETHGAQTEEFLQLEFVRQNKIEFMIVRDGKTMPSIFEPYVDTVFYRPNTTEKFVFFNTWK